MMQNTFMKISCFWLVVIFGNVTGYAQNGLPDATIYDLSGSQVSAKTVIQHDGPILLVFWTTTCHNMIKGLVDIDDDYYEDWNENHGLKIVAISVDDARNHQKVKPFVNGKGWEYEVYVDPNKDLMRAMNVDLHPYLILIDRNGSTVWQKSSFLKGDENTVAEALEEHF